MSLIKTNRGRRLFIELNNTRALLCVPICERTFADAAESIARAPADADLIELRLDCLEQRTVQALLERLRAFLAEVRTPVILTLRPDDQGGAKMRLQDRLEFWRLAGQLGADFFDIEASLIPQVSVTENISDRVIASHHDFSGVPLDLNEIYQSMKELPARIIKIAVRAADVTDCLPIFQLMDQARQDGREVIAIAMGEAGISTRVLGPSRGSLLTYGSLDYESATAPGQISADDLLKTYRIRDITRTTQILGLVGRPTSHSLSPAIHNAAFAAAGLDAVYLPFEVQDLDSFMKRMVDSRSREIDWNMRGFSVTAPHKSDIIDYLDWIEPSAREIGAVNTVTVGKDGIRGFNTDADALVKPLWAMRGTLDDTRCAVIGTGGAARTAVWTLRRGGAHVTVFGRNTENAERLADDFGVTWSKLAGAIFAEFDVVVNATPLGTLGQLESQSAASAEQLRGAGLVYDLVYNPNETKLLHEASKAGCATLNGLSMLINQAMVQYRLWIGQDATEAVMRTAAKNALQKQLKTPR